MEELICKFSKKGLTPSQIGVLLRDNHGIAQVTTVTGSKVLRILKGHGSRPFDAMYPFRCLVATSVSAGRGGASFRAAGMNCVV